MPGICLLLNVYFLILKPRFYGRLKLHPSPEFPEGSPGPTESERSHLRPQTWDVRGSYFSLPFWLEAKASFTWIPSGPGSRCRERMRLKSLQRSRSPQLSCLWRLANTHCVNQFLRVFHLFTHLSAYPSSPVYHSSACLSIHRAIIYQWVPHPLLYLPIHHIPIHHPSTRSSIHLFTHLPTHLCLHLLIHP